MKIPFVSRFVLVASAFASLSSFAIPRALMDYRDLPDTGMDFASAYDFDGIIALSNCSGSLIRFQTSLPTEKAIVLTNGHCLGGRMPKPGVVVVDRAVSREMWVLNPATGKKLGAVNAVRVLYATMTKTDITLYQLSETYAEIEAKYGTHALTLASHYPTVGEAIDVVSGYWRRGYSCKVDGIVHELREADWTMVDSIRYSRPGCETIGGTSGSPILSVDSKEVVGINNTGNESGGKCTMNNPCEVDATGKVSYEKGLSYGQQTSWIYTCLTAERKIDLTLAGCLLAKPVARTETDTNPAPRSTWPNSALK